MSRWATIISIAVVAIETYTFEQIQTRGFSKTRFFVDMNLRTHNIQTVDPHSWPHSLLSMLQNVNNN